MDSVRDRAFAPSSDRGHLGVLREQGQYPQSWAGAGRAPFTVGGTVGFGRATSSVTLNVWGASPEFGVFFGALHLICSRAHGGKTG